MKNIYEGLLESEQLRLETDNAGPQDELEYWKTRAARLSLLVDQISSQPCKMTVVTLKAAQCKLIKVGSSLRTIREMPRKQRLTSPARVILFEGCIAHIIIFAGDSHNIVFQAILQ